MDIDEELKSAIPAMMDRVKRDLIARIELQAAEVAMNEARKAAQEWAAEVLVPELRAQLEAGKAGMIAAAKRCAERVGDELANALVEQAKKNLTKSWTMSNVAKELFQ